ncbi:Hpt domain-containing protein [Clostridium transplantifaecale]|uniref:Hpt domain-containing protein n=1 Tax=Clostridium transplantifaecale TaxID=2479838 RepID=UPI000F643372|nr:Hpt domain-containing protein [Clostridium transplantifaecale]
MQSFREILESYGVDYDNTMTRFLGNETFYLKILGRLPQDNNLAALEDALDKGDLGTAFEAAHTIKGLAGNLGLQSIYEAVSAMVEPLRAGNLREDYKSLYQVLRREYLKVEKMRLELEEHEGFQPFGGV